MMHAVAWSAGNPLEEHFLVNDGTVLDKNTGLRWQRCSVGMSWQKNNKCGGKAKKMTFLDAQRINGSDALKGMWRIPSKTELESLVEKSGEDFKIRHDIFPDVDHENNFFWTSDRYDSSNAWFVEFFHGNSGHVAGDYVIINNKWNVRLVHFEGLSAD